MILSFMTPENILQKIADLIFKASGIDFPDSHKKVLDQRIQQRLRELGCTADDLYVSLLNKDNLFEFIGFVTTNHTLFFRSIEQFHVLGSVMIPELLEKNKITRHIAIWSCASSSGEEPYTLALYLHHYFKTNNLLDWSFSIIATDIDQTSINTAIKGEYSYRVLVNIPKEYHTYFDVQNVYHPETNEELEEDRMIVVKPEIKKYVKFQIHNLMDKPPYHNQDIVFCRNVLIYFNPETQERVVRDLATSLTDDRYLVISPSESITGFRVPFTPVILPKSIYYIYNKK